MSSKLSRCSVNDLVLGMYVEQLDRPWLETSLLFQGFYIRSEDELRQLRESCEFVYVDNQKCAISPEYEKLRATAIKKTFISECLDENEYVPTAPDSVRHSHSRSNSKASYYFKRVSDGVRRSSLRWVLAPVLAKVRKPRTALGQSVARADHTYEKAQEVMTSVFEKCRSGEALDMNAIERVVTPVIDSVLQSPDAMTCVVRMRNKDQYTYNHSLAVSIWAVVFGKYLGFDADNLKAIGLGGLLLDIGKMRIADELLQKRDPLSPEEMKEIRRHVEYGLEILGDSGPVDVRIKNMIETHHERHNGTGYPNGLVGDSIPVFGRIAGIVDSYDAMTSLRPYAPARSTYHAMRHLLDQSDLLFQNEMVERFIQVVGIFPTATLVEMNTGEVGIVVEQNRTRRLRPKVMLVLDAAKNLRADFPIVNLAERPAEQDSEAGIWIVRGLETGSFGIDPAEYYL